MTLDDAPNGGFVNCVVAVDDTVAKTHDSVKTFDAGRSRGVGLRQPVQGLTDNFTFTLDGPAELAISLVFGKAASLAPLPDAPAGYEHIKQQLLRAVVHRRADESPRLHGGSRDCESTVP